MGPITENPDRLAELDPADFYAVITEFAAAHWVGSEGRLDAAPPSPSRETELRLPDGTLIHVSQYTPPDVVSENALRELAAFEDDAVAITTADFAEGARTLAAAEGIELIDGERFRRLLKEYRIEVPEPRETELEDLVEELASYWSGSLSDIAREVARTIDSAGKGEFEYVRSRGDYSTDLDVIPAEETEPVAKLRFSPVGLRLYVRRDGWERVVGVPAHGEYVPPDLREQVREAIASLG